MRTVFWSMRHLLRLRSHGLFGVARSAARPSDLRGQGLDGRGAQVPGLAVAHATVPRLDFLVPHHQHVGDLLHLGLADLVAHLLVAVVHVRRAPRARRSSSAHLARVLVVPLGHRDDHRLHRRQPERERARVVLDQHAEEALQAAQQRAVDHDRLVRLAVLADVLELEAVRVVEVHLDGRALPGAVQRVLDLDVDLRPVEDALARDRPGTAGRATSSALLERRGRRSPTARRVPAGVRRARGEVDVVLGRSRRSPRMEVTKSSTRTISASSWSGRQKRCASSWVKPRTRMQAVQHARALEAVDRAQLRVAERQLAVAAQLRACRS